MKRFVKDRINKRDRENNKVFVFDTLINIYVDYGEARLLGRL